MIFGKSVAFDREGLPQVASATYDSHAFAEAEADFIERLRSGDPEAFDNLITRYSLPDHGKRGRSGGSHAGDVSECP